MRASAIGATLVAAACCATFAQAEIVNDPSKDAAARRVRDAFRVEGVALLDKPAQGAGCAASIFPALKWCATGPRYETLEGATFTKSLGFNVDEQGRVVYVIFTRREYPLARANFDETLKTMSARYGSAPVTITHEGKTADGDPYFSLIAVWGNIKLVRLTDAEYRTAGENGLPGKGHLVDHLQDIRASLRVRDAVYRIDGTAGFVAQFKSVTDIRSDVVVRAVYQPAFTGEMAKETPVAKPEPPRVPLDPLLALEADKIRFEEERKAAIERARREESERKEAAERARREEIERREAAERAKREAEERARREEEERKVAEARRMEEERRAALERARRAAEEERAAAEERVRRAEAEKKAAEERRIAEEKRRQDEAERKAAEERRRVEAERKAAEERRLAEERRIAEERARRAEAERRAAEERARLEAAERRAAEERRAVEERARRAESELKAAEERARRAEAERKAAEERVRQAEVERRAAEEAARRAESERRAAEERRGSEERARREESERRIAEDRVRRDDSERKAAEHKRELEDQRLAEERAKREAAAREDAERQDAEERAKRQDAARKIAAERRAAEEKRAADEYARRTEAERKDAEQRARQAASDREAQARRDDQMRTRRAEAERQAADAWREAEERAKNASSSRDSGGPSGPAPGGEDWLKMATARAQKSATLWMFQRGRDPISDDLFFRAQAVFSSGPRLALEIAFECNIEMGKRLKAHVRVYDTETKASLRIPADDGQASIVRGNVVLDDDAPQTAFLFPERDERQASIVEVPVTDEDIKKSSSRAQVWLRHYQVTLKLRIPQGEMLAIIYPYDENLRRVLEACSP